MAGAVAIPRAAFWRRLKALYDAWAHAPANWGGADAILLPRGQREDDVLYGRHISVQLWLFGYELPDLLMLVTKKGAFVLAGRSKIDHLAKLREPPAEFTSLTLLEKKKGEDKAGIDELLKHLREAGGPEVKRVGTLLKEQKGDLVGACFKQLREAGVETVEVGPALGACMQLKDEEELACTRKSAEFSAALMRKFLRNELLSAIDEEKKVTHAEFAAKCEAEFQKPATYVPGIDAAHLETAYTPIVMSGGQFDLKPSAQSNGSQLASSGAIIAELGSRYKGYCSNLARTFIVNPTKAHEEAYEAVFAALVAAKRAARAGQKAAGVYAAALAAVSKWAAHATKDCGFGTGLDFRDASLVLNAKNPTTLRPNMVLNLAFGLENLPLSGGGSFAVLLADTVVVRGGDSEPESLTGAPSEYHKVAFQFESNDKAAVKKKDSAAVKKEGAAAKGSKAADMADEEEEDEDEEEEDDEDDEEDSAADDAAPATKRQTRGSARAAGAASSSSSTGATAEAATAAAAAAAVDEEANGSSDLYYQQRLLAKQLNDERLQALKATVGQELTRDVGDGVIRGFKSPEVFPEQARPPMVYVDVKNECVFCPIFGHMVPFHISTIKNVHKQDQGAHTHIRINFITPINMNARTDPLPKQADARSVFLSELSYRDRLDGDLSQAYLKIRELKKQVAIRQKEFEEKKSLVEQKSLVLRKNPQRLNDVLMRPAFGRSKVTGSLEAHENGFRFQGTKREESLDIIYENVKCAFFSPVFTRENVLAGIKKKELLRKASAPRPPGAPPAPPKFTKEEEEMWSERKRLYVNADRDSTNVLLHFELNNPIMIGKKKSHYVQFWVEAVEASQDLDARQNDADGELEENRDHEQRFRENERFLKFMRGVEAQSRVKLNTETVSEYHKLRFRGVPSKEHVVIYPMLSWVVALDDTPPLVLHLKEVEVVWLERVDVSKLNKGSFDMTFVRKDHNSVAQIFQIESKLLDNIREWLQSVSLVFYESTVNLSWKKMLEHIKQDEKGFYEDGGWETYMQDDEDEEEEEGGEAEEESDFEPSDEEEEEDDEEFESDEEDEEEDEEEEAEDEDDDEEAADWDELDRKAEEEDRAAARREREEDRLAREARKKGKRAKGDD
jgi:nucleosome binding factor SPN SPT16 subunit